MGLIRWLKKEIDVTNFQRRQSAPPKPIKSFDPNKSRDEAYLRAMAKFIEWRNNERKRRASEVVNSPTGVVSSTATESQRYQQYPQSVEETDHERRISGGSSPIDDLLISSNSNIYGCGSHGTAQSEYAEVVGGTATRNPADPSRVSRTESKQRIGIPRQHSLPSNMSKNYITKAYKRKKKAPAPQPTADPNIIHEDEVNEFEGYHCIDGFGDGAQSNPLSPPTKFYKQNSNPYPLFASDKDQGLSSIGNGIDAKRLSVNLQNCPTKPRRLMLKPQNVQKNTKELTEAHFQGTYQNYEVHSPYYEGRARDFGMATISTEPGTNRPGQSDSDRYSPQYLTTVNKHGEMVEYAIPFCEQRKRDSRLDEVDFLDDDIQNCENVINQNFRFLNAEKFGETDHVSRSSLYNKRPRKACEQVLVTDLDKSLDSSKTLDDKRQSHDIFEELNSLSKCSGNLSTYTENNRSQRDLVQLLKAVKTSMPFCRVDELKTKVTVLQNTYPSPLEIISGIFRKTKVTLRNYPMTENEVKGPRMALAAEAIKRDLEILRHIRHRNLIMLMAVSFSLDHRQITLVLEPADCTLHYFLYQMKEKSTLFDSILIVQQIASAALYLHECGFVHSNISSHSILVSKSPNYVKLSSFELTTSLSGTTQKEIESKYRRNSKRTDETGTNIPIYALLMRNNDDMLNEHYRNMSEQLSREVGASPAYSSQCLSDIDANFLPYYIEYRRQFSVYNYQAPELLTLADRFVFPSRRCDVYSLTMLLWELLNYCVPYVIYNESELKRLYCENKVELPMFEKDRCAYFKQIFKYGTAVDPTNRSITVQHFISLLEDIKFDIDPQNNNNMTGGGNLRLLDVPTIEADLDDERKESIYENTNDIINDIDAQVISPMLMNEANRNFMPSPKATKDSPAANSDNIVLSPLHNITSSTSYRSVMDFQKLLSPHRNSTMKRRPNQKISPYYGESPNLNENISHIFDGLDHLEQPIDTSIIGPVTVREGQLPSRKTIQHQQNKFMDQILGDQKENQSMNISKWSERNEPIVITLSPNKQHTGVATAHENPTNIQIVLNNSMHNQKQQRGNVVESVSEMQIARKNQIRRNEWLSNDANVEQFFVAPPLQRATDQDIESCTTSSSPTGSTKNAVIGIDEVNKLSPSASTNSSTASDETVPLNRKVNVSIKIVRKQLTPEKNDITTKSNVTDNNVSMYNNEESPSVLSRIKFWNSLECPTISPKIPFKPNSTLNQSARMPELVDDDRSSLAPTPLPLPQPSRNRRILQEINDISAEITRCMDASPLSKLIKAKEDLNTRTNPIKSHEMFYTEKPILNDLTNSVSQSFKPMDNLIENVRLEKEIQEKENELLAQRENASLITSKLQDKTIDESVLKGLIATQRRSSVLATVFRIENGLNVNNSPLNSTLKKIENKLFNEKINNTDLNAEEILPMKNTGDIQLKGFEEASKVGIQNVPITDDVREIQGKIIGIGDVENDASNMMLKVELPKIEVLENTETRKELLSPVVDSRGKKANTTMIKRTFYRESIITGSGIETPELERMLDTQTTMLSHSASKSKLTTRVTLNLRNFKRRSSEFGLPQLDTDELNQSPRMTEARHSICGNELAFGCRSSNVINTTSGRALEQFLNGPGALRNVSCTCVPTSLSQLSMNFSTKSNRKDIQSIEDLYIDDDFCQGLCLAANMKLVTNSNDTLGMDNIDFDVLSTRIYEKANESLNGDFDDLDAEIRND